MSGRTHECTLKTAFGRTGSHAAGEKRATSRLEKRARNWRDYLGILSMLAPTILIVFAAVISVGS